MQDGTKIIIGSDPICGVILPEAGQIYDTDTWVFQPQAETGECAVLPSK